jgi:hypothetical protein
MLPGSPDAPAFRTTFCAFLSAAQAVVSALRKDGARHDGFRKWHNVRVAAMQQDPLMRFVLDARNADLHEGRHRLLFNTHVERFETAKAGDPPGGYPASMTFGPEGPAWVVDEGKPTRRVVPIRQGGSWITVVAIADGPSTHKGHQLTPNDPVSVCGLAADYLGELVHDAEQRFT